jgi:beta-lactamase class A
MRKRGSIFTLRWISTYLLLGAVFILILLVVWFARLREDYPAGMMIANVPVGGLDSQECIQRLNEVYTTPIELQYRGERIHLHPTTVGFQLDADNMLAVADVTLNQQAFWKGFLNYVWGHTGSQARIPMQYTYSKERLRAYLKSEIAARYDQPSLPASPVVGTLNYRPGSLGKVLDIDRSVLLIEDALRSPTKRVVKLPLKNIQPSSPTFQNLEIFLKQTIDLSSFDGLVGLYLMDLQTAQEIHFAYELGEDLSTDPDVAFTAASIIKIPIMVSVFRRIGDNPNPETLQLLEKMIERSGNEPADWVMESEISQWRGPLDVSADMQILGLENTFLAGQFYPGAPLLSIFKTPANNRIDINTDPDIYNQTTLSDIGMLLEDIYQCSQTGGGTLAAVFSGEITQTECQTMITYLTRNRIGLLIEAGVPDGTRIAHKHGWVTLFGIMNTLGDAAIVYTPSGNYVLVIFLYQPVQLIWDPASQLVADLSTIVFNYFNLPNQ